MKSVRRNEDAFTGLEAAIVLIAFVVVAAVFSYVVLGAGFFTTQKSQETVHTAVGQASSAVEILGNVYGIGTAGSAINTINFSIGLASGGTPVDIQKTVLTYSTGTEYKTLSFAGTDAAGHNATGSAMSAGNWAITEQKNILGGGTGNMVLDNGEQFTITVIPPTDLVAYKEFTIDIKPPVGAALSIHRTVPAYIDAVNLLY